MLVLSRKRAESFLINDTIVVTVLHISGKRVRLGIEAPAEMTVHRKEVREKLRRPAKSAPLHQATSEPAVP